ncbi:MAG: tetratricopeptide repeat protein [Candidatus Omnitrophota bacterium]
MKNDHSISGYTPALLAIGIVAVTAVIYHSALCAGFVNWDDSVYVINNKLVRSLAPSNIARMWTSFNGGFYIPLVWLTYAVTYHFWGLDPRMYHLVNVAFHCANAALVFILFRRLLAVSGHRDGSALPGRGTGLAIAGLAAVLWSIHPLRVESVAWVTEMKDVGCTFFFLLSLLAYVRYAAAPARNMVFGGMSLLFFMLSLLYKQTVILLPLVMLCLDKWPLGRLGRIKDVAGLLREKAPFFILSIVSGVMLYVAHSTVVGITPIKDIPLSFRVMNAFHSAFFYLAKTFLPVGLFPLYPILRPHETAFSFENVLSCILVILISAASFIWGRGRRSYIPVAWLIYLFTLVPSIGIVQSGRQAAADRFSYIPAMSITFLVSAAIISFPSLFKRRIHARIARAAVIAMIPILLITLGILTVNQISIWKDPISLWKHAARGYPVDSSLIHGNLAEAYMEAGETDKAIAEYRIAISIDPKEAKFHLGLLNALHKANRQDEAMAELMQALSSGK